MIARPHPLADLTFGVSTAPRSSGLHMSDIYNDLFQRIDPKRYRGDRPMDLLRVEAGLALESSLEAALIERQQGERPGEFQTPEGIAFSPDLIAFEGRLVVVGEMKLTWMSAKEFPVSPTQSEETGLPCTWDGTSEPDFPGKADKYFAQLKTYCYHVDTPHGRLYVYFVNGDWRPPTPSFLCWDFTFSRQELAEAWAMVKNHAMHRGML